MASPPQRRSCNRCHAQKVRCIRDPALGETADGVSIQCLRCKRAGVACIYSAQQRAGRPPSGRANPAPSSPRKRQLNEPYPGPSFSTPDLNPMPAVTIEPELLLSLPPLPGGNDSGPEAESVLDDVNTQQQARAGDDWFGGLDGHSPILWPSPCFGNPHEATSGTKSITTIAHEPDTTPCAPDPIENIIQELAELNVRILHSARAVSDAITTPPSASSPLNNEIFETTGSLIDLLNRLPRPNMDVPHSATFGILGLSPTALGDLPTVNRPDAGVVLMVLACHQRLLSAFENMFLCVYHHLQPSQSLAYSPFEPLQPLQPMARSGQQSLSSSTTQALLTIELISHLLDRLDRAFGSLATDTARQPSRPSKRPRSPSSVSSSSMGSSSSFCSPEPHGRCRTSQANVQEAECALAELRRNDGQLLRRTNLCDKVANSVVGMMQDRQNKLRDQMKMVKRFIRRSNVS
jgi:hypothetical protein